MYARDRQLRASNTNVQKILLVGMSKTPEQPDLPFVEQELELIQQLKMGNYKLAIPPIRQTVLDEIVHHQIVHLACHGHSAVDPSQSMLLLEDWKTSPLTVSDLMSLNIREPQLAFLSACHTATMRDPRLLDESINLASAVSLAGFPSVVGTLWQVMDKNSAEVSRDVYAWMLDEKEKFDNLRSAEGLHQAVCVLKNKTRMTPGIKSLGRHDPIVWAPYIHVGV
jgi:CHAT domain-containing protein